MNLANRVLKALRSVTKLGNCGYCGKELFFNDISYGNKIIHELACEACYLKEIKPQNDSLTQSQGGKEE